MPDENGRTSNSGPGSLSKGVKTFPYSVRFTLRDLTRLDAAAETLEVSGRQVAREGIRYYIDTLLPHAVRTKILSSIGIVEVTHWGAAARTHLAINMRFCRGVPQVSKSKTLYDEALDRSLDVFVAHLRDEIRAIEKKIFVQAAPEKPNGV